ncbi:MAG: hypothetical protein JST85_01040 [Acidobacteria bacterium]|nr:hypothetical protein [Acidobacteriota bacterium]
MSLICDLKEMRTIPGATHLFEEPGAMESAAQSASAWFVEHLQARLRTSAPHAMS